NTTTYADGSYSLTAKATDNAGHESTCTRGSLNANISRDWMTVVCPSGVYVQGTVQITATASDTNGVKQVEFFVDGTSIGVDTNGADDWSVDWDTSEGLDGEHTLTAKATDNANNIGDSTPVSVTVDNNAAPTVSITSPADGSTVNKPVTIVANATDDAGVSSVAFYYVDGGTDVLIGNGTASGDVWTYSGWNPADGQYTLKAV